MIIIRKIVAPLLLIIMSAPAMAIPILSVDADTLTDGVQNSLTVDLGDTFSILTVVNLADPFLDAFDTIIYNLDSSSNILTQAGAVLAGALASTAPIFTVDIFGAPFIVDGSMLAQDGVSGTSIGMTSAALPFGLGTDDVGIALYNFTASSVGTTTLSIVPDLGGILALGGFDVPSLTVSATITVQDVVTVPEPGTLGLMAAGLLLLITRRRRQAVR